MREIRATRFLSLACASGPTARARRVLIAVPLAPACALLLVLVLGCAPALAVKRHVFAGSFGVRGSGDGQLLEPAGVAVREATLSEPSEDVYVVDAGNDRVERFSSTGAFISAWGWGVSNGEAKYEVCTSGCRAGVAGEGAGQLDAPGEIAVDNSTSPLDPSAGDVYVANTADDEIEKFGPEGAFIGQVSTGSQPALGGVAVDPSGNLWAYEANGEIDGYSNAVANVETSSKGTTLSDYGFGAIPGFAVNTLGDFYVNSLLTVIELNDEGNANLNPIDEKESTAVAIDLATNDLYIGNVTSVAGFDSNDSPIERFGSPRLKSTGGVAVSSAAGRVYVADTAADTLDDFALLLVPTVAVTTATEVEGKDGTVAATLVGSVDPEGVEVEECFFEYGTSLPSGKTALCEPAPGASGSTVAVQARVSGLVLNRTYVYRVVAKNANGVSESESSSFATPAGEMTLTAEPLVTAAEKQDGKVVATLQGSVDPGNEEATNCRFEYGTSLPSGQTVACEPATVPGSETVEVMAKVSGLQAGARYEYRLLAEDSFGLGESENTEEFNIPVAVVGVTKCGASGLLNQAATLHGSLEPEGLSTSWFFEYRKAGSTETWSKSAEGGVEKPTGRFADPEEGVSGLEQDTTYECRLVASNLYGSTTSTEGQEKEGEPVGNHEFTTALPPEVVAAAAAEVGFSSVTLNATINGFGAADSYRFEYGTSETYGSSTPEVTLKDPVRGEAPVSVQLTGLQPATTYHFRIVVTQPDGGGTATGVDVKFTTFPETSAQLPDGRVYEMVSPVEAQGANVYVPEAHNGVFPVPTQLPFQASTGGEAVAYVGAPAAGGSGDAGAGGGNEYVAALGAGGWVSQDVMPQGSSQLGYLAFSPDLSVGVFESHEPLASGAPGGGYDVLYKAASGGGVGALFSQRPPDRSAEEFGSAGTLGPQGPGLAYAGASADFSHVLFEANDALVPEAEGDPGVGANDLYDSVGGQLGVVNILPASEGGRVAPDATFGGPNGTGNAADPPDFSNVISEDGSRVFWTDLQAGPQEGRVYVRENGTSTVAVSAGAARFWTATPDGRYAFYTEGEKLYRFDVESEMPEELAGADAGVLGVIGVSEDGEYVYFVAEGKLAGSAKQGEPNLYLLHGGETRFIATLSPEDEGTMAYGGEGGSFGDWEPGLGHRTAEVTPDGKSVVFQSVRALTGYDSEGLSEVFVYDSEAGGGLFCGSCDASGELPPVTELAGGRVKAAGYLPVGWSRTYQPRVISEDGSRVFFDSFEPLVSADPNGQQDVYEWERDGTGACREPRGCQYLLSGGTSRSGSYLLDASANGDSVFFVSDARLVAQDDNESDHLYDDRVDGVQPSSPAGCAGSECEEVPIAPPIFATPPSATFAGVGNFPPPANAPVKPKSKPKRKQKPKRRHRKAKGNAGKHTGGHGKKSSARRARNGARHPRRRTGS